MSSPIPGPLNGVYDLNNGAGPIMTDLNGPAWDPTSFDSQRQVRPRRQVFLSCS